MMRTFVESLITALTETLCKHHEPGKLGDMQDGLLISPQRCTIRT